MALPCIFLVAANATASAHLLQATLADRVAAPTVRFAPILLKNSTVEAEGDR
jgi:hypothetical protein